MAKFTQTGRPLRIDTPLGADKVLVVKVAGAEAISMPYRFELDLLAEEALDFDRLVGQAVRVTMTLANGGERYVHGILSSVSEGGRGAGPDEMFLSYHAELVPALWLLSQRVQSRVLRRDGNLQNSVPDILQLILRDEWRLPVSFRLTGQYPARDHCVQYRESDLAFISRLMEEEGIYYYFSHQKDGYELVVTDAVSGCQQPTREAVVYDASAGGNKREPRIRHWQKTQHLRPVRYTVRDHSFQKPDSNLQGQQAVLVPEQVKIGAVQHQLNRRHEVDGTEMLEVYDYPGGFAHRFDGVGAGGQPQPQDLETLAAEKDRLVRLRMQEQAAQCLQVRGNGDCADLVPGHLFKLARHPSADGSYLVTRVEHEASQPIAASGAIEASYTNTFACLPEALPYRPQRTTPRPHIDGTQTATVVGPAGQKTFVDKFGRVKVQFRWDRHGKSDGNSSGWVRVAQPWAGYRHGAFFWPRVGHEVVVSFEEGDPDRPIVVGSVYNAQNMPPFELPDAVLTAGVKSSSLGKDPAKAFNGILFHDEPGNESVHIHGEKQTNLSDEEHKDIRVGKSQRTVIGGPFFGLPKGSGAGGGFLGVDWDKLDAQWGNNSVYDYGHRLFSNVGFVAMSKVGGMVTAITNPVALASVMGKGKCVAAASEGWKRAGDAMGGVLDVMGGFCSYVVGANTLVNYGSGLIASHGSSLKTFAELTGPDAVPTATAIKICVGLFSTAQITLAMTPFLPGPYWTQYLVEGLGGVILAANLALEENTARTQDAVEMQREADRINRELTDLRSRRVDPEIMEQHVAVLKKLIKGITNVVAAMRGEVQDLRDVSIIPDGPFRVAAAGISITSQHRALPAGIELSAQGNMANPVTPGDGLLNMRASGSAMLKAGDAGSARYKNTILLQDARGPADCGICVESDRGIRLRQYQELARPNTTDPRLELKGRSIKLLSGAAADDQGPRISMVSADGDASTLTIAAGDGTGPRIILTNTSIQLVTPANGTVTIQSGARTLTVSNTDVTVQ